MATAQPAQHPIGEETGDLALGAAVGRFEIHRLLGRGSMGAVYLARDPLIDREVAVKTLAGDFSVSAGELHLLRRRFLNEARSAGAMRHPGIVTIYDVIESDDGRVSIAMEYVAGSSLRARLDDHEPIPLEFVAETISSIAETLDYAHSKGVVHRDIKPANILLSADGSFKIADFGIASLRGGDLALELNALGTPNYLAPERILGREADHRADVYALGVILYEMLTRRLPYQGSTLGELARNVVQGDLADPRALRPDLPDRMAEILAKVLDRDRNRRYQSAGELAREVRETVNAQAALSGTVPSTPVEELELLDLEDLENLEEFEELGVSEETEVEEGEEEEDAQYSPDPRAFDSGIPVSQLRRLRGGVIRLPAKSVRAATWGFGGLFALVVLIMSISAFGRDSDANALEAAEALRRSQYESLVVHSERLFAIGDYRGAEEMLKRAEAVSPEAVGISQLRAEAERRRLSRYEAERRAEARAHFVDARAAFEKQDLEATERALELLFDVDAEHEGGVALAAAVPAVRSALARSARRPSPPPVVEKVEEPIVVESAPVFEAFESAPEEPWVDPFGTMRIDFRSERPRGVLTLYLNGEQILRRPFRFVEKQGLLRRKGVSGGFDERQQVEAGDFELKVYLTLPSRPAQSRSIRGGFAGGSLRTLQVRVDDSGQLLVDFF
jgi:serine/threonine protein kinase